jgi:phosphatidylglycerophosphate synthase
MSARDRPPPLLAGPNLLSMLRIALVPVLWVVALLRLPVVVGIGWAVAALTDVLDGIWARRARRTSAFGSRLDSVADHLLSASGVGWILLLRPEFVREHWLPLAGWLLLAVISLATGWVRFRQLGGLHLYSAKAAGFVAPLFGISLLVLGAWSTTVFYLVLGITVLATVEFLLAALTIDRPDESAGSLLLRRDGR